MYDVTLVREELEQVLDAVRLIQARFEPVRSVEDFLLTNDGLMRLNSICMLFIAIGENVKGIDRRTRNELLPKYPEIPWKDVIGTRDYLSHHYFEKDAETIFKTCSLYLDDLEATVSRILVDLGG